MNKEKILLETPKFDVVEREDKPGIVSRVENRDDITFYKRRSGTTTNDRCT